VPARPLARRLLLDESIKEPGMNRRRPWISCYSAGVVTLIAALLAAKPAFARRAKVVGVRVQGAAVIAPVYVGVYRFPPPPCCWIRPYPRPVMVVEGTQAPRPAPAPKAGIALGGSVHAPRSGQPALGGSSLALQFGVSPRGLFALELETLRAEGNGMRRRDTGALLAGRLYLWNAPLSLFLEGAGGAMRARHEVLGESDRATQLVARGGAGLELRLGRHLALEGRVSRVRRFRIDDRSSAAQVSCGCIPAQVADHERATELRAALALRF
jgi:hypothetical protein